MKQNKLEIRRIVREEVARELYQQLRLLGFLIFVVACIILIGSGIYLAISSQEEMYDYCANDNTTIKECYDSCSDGWDDDWCLDLITKKDIINRYNTSLER